MHRSCPRILPATKLKTTTVHNEQYPSIYLAKEYLLHIGNRISPEIFIDDSISTWRKNEELPNHARLGLMNVIERCAMQDTFPIPSQSLPSGVLTIALLGEKRQQRPRRYRITKEIDCIPKSTRLLFHNVIWNILFMLFS